MNTNNLDALDEIVCDDRWVSVGEERPEIGVEVCFIRKNKLPCNLSKWRYYFGIFTGDTYHGFWVWKDQQGKCFYDITHWRQKPEPPTDK